MTYHIKKGTRVRIRPPNAKTTDWRQHQTRIDLQFVAPRLVDRDAFIFDHNGWRIRIRKSEVDQVRDEQSA